MKHDNGVIIACLDDLVQDAPDEPIPEKGSVSSSSTQDKKGSQVEGHEQLSHEEALGQIGQYLGWLGSGEAVAVRALPDKGSGKAKKYLFTTDSDVPAAKRLGTPEEVLAASLEGQVGFSAQINEGAHIGPITAKDGSTYQGVISDKACITSKRAVYLDVDLPPTFEQAQALAQFCKAFPPTCRVNSSVEGKFHLYWDIRGGDQPGNEKWVSIQETLVRLFGSDPACKNLASLLRIPGTINWKPQNLAADGSRPWARLGYLEASRIYRWQELADWLTEANGGELVSSRAKRPAQGNVVNILTGQLGEDHTSLLRTKKKDGKTPDPHSPMSQLISHETLRFLEVDQNRNEALRNLAIKLAGAIRALHSLDAPEDWLDTPEGQRLVLVGQLRSDKPGEAEEAVLHGFQHARRMMDEGEYQLYHGTGTTRAIRTRQWMTCNYSGVHYNQPSLRFEFEGEAFQHAKAADDYLAYTGEAADRAALADWVERSPAVHPHTEWLAKLEPLPLDRFSWEELAWQMLGEKDDPWATAWVRVFMLSLIRRGLHPGCVMNKRFDLVSREGSGKSALLTGLATEDFHRTCSAGAEDEMVKRDRFAAVIMEMTELDSGRSQKHIEAIKAVISERNTVFRAPYARDVIDAPAQFIWAATSNRTDLYVPGNDNRRFYPFVLDDKWKDRNPLPFISEWTPDDEDHNWVKDHREELFAWAKAVYLDNPKLASLTEAENAARLKVVAYLENESPLQARIEKVLYDLSHYDQAKESNLFIRPADLAQALAGGGSPKPQDISEVRRVLTKLGWQIGQVKVLGGSRPKGFVSRDLPKKSPVWAVPSGVLLVVARQA